MMMGSVGLLEKRTPETWHTPILLSLRTAHPSYLSVAEVVSACVKSSPMLKIPNEVAQCCMCVKSSPACVK